MENVTDAIYMASAMLLFLIALSVAMFAVRELRQASDAVFSQTETVEMSRNGSQYVNYMQSSSSARIVDSATVVSSMMRSSKENYVVYIKLKDSNEIPNRLIGKEKNQVVLSTADSDLEINGTKYISKDDKLIEITIGDKRNGVNQESEEILSNGFYDDVIKNKTFYEYLGVYQNKSDASSENKVTYRIITYVEI